MTQMHMRAHLVPLLFLTALGSAHCAVSTETRQPSTISEVHRLAGRASPESIRRLAMLFEQEPLQFSIDNRPLVRVEIVHALGQQCKTLKEASDQLVDIAQEFLPKATAPGFFGPRYARSSEYVETTSTLFAELSHCPGDRARLFIDSVLENNEQKYEQHATLQAARAKLLGQCADLPTDQRVAFLVDQLDDGIPASSDYTRKGVRSKRASLDLAAMELLAEMGPASLPVLNRIYDRMSDQVPPAEKRQSVMLVLARILARAGSGEAVETRKSINRLQAYLEDAQHLGSPSVGSVRWYVERAAVAIPAIVTDYLHVNRKVLGQEKQESVVDSLRKAVGQAYREEKIRRLGKMDATTKQAYEHVVSLSDDNMIDALDQVIGYLHTSTDEELDRAILERMSKLASRNADNGVWTRARVEKLLDIAAAKDYRICSEIGRIAGVVTGPQAVSACVSKLESDSPRTQFAALRSLGARRDGNLLGIVVDYVNSSDENLRLLSRRILSQSGIGVGGKSENELQKEVRGHLNMKGEEGIEGGEKGE